jgi:hypothetical protein
MGVGLLLLLLLQDFISFGCRRCGNNWRGRGKGGLLSIGASDFVSDERGRRRKWPERSFLLLRCSAAIEYMIQHHKS